MDGMMRVELPQDVAAQVRAISKIIKEPAWRIVAEAIAARWGDPQLDPDEEFADLFQDTEPCQSSS